MKNLYFLKLCICLLTITLISCAKENSEEQLIEEVIEDDPVIVYDINEVSSLVLSRRRVLRNQMVTLELKGANDVDYTNFATFYVNGTPINGNTFMSPSEDVFEVYAEYDLAGTLTETPLQSFEVFIPKRKVLFEDYTGTWCGYCTAMTGRTEEMKAETDNVAVVGIHLGNDPFAFVGAQELMNYYEVIFIPTGYSNREYFYGDAWPITVALDSAGEEVNTTIGINSNLEGDQLSVDIKVMSEVDLNTNKVVVFLLEDGLIYNQANFYNGEPSSPYYGMGNPIIDFEHNDVLRTILTNDVFGDPIPVTTAFSIYTNSYTHTIPGGYNLNKLKLVVSVVNEDNVAINTQHADVNQLKGFQ
jgi:thiol-disulfide isomerase/thioredoxin